MNWGFSVDSFGFFKIREFWVFSFHCVGNWRFFFWLLWGGEILRSGVCDIHCMFFRSVFHFMLV